jgi:hypothetical protein
LFWGKEELWRVGAVVAHPRSCVENGPPDQGGEESQPEMVVAQSS